jgi:hypothetical protein
VLGENIFSLAYKTSGSQVISLIGYMSGTGYESAEDDIYLTYVGISGPSKINSLKVFPNPSKGYVTVDLPENFNENYTIDVYSLSGAKVYSTKINNSDNRINIENLKDGLYIIKLENNGEIYSQKIQLQK